jgi:hypothetical protein
VPFAVLRTTQLGAPGSQLLWTDASGNFCVEADGGATLPVFGVASSAASGLLRIDTTIGPFSSPQDAAAPLCSGDASTCGNGGALMAMPYGLRCVQGMIEQTAWEVSWNAIPTADGAGTGGYIEPGKPFCIEVPGDSMLRISTSSGECGDMQTIAAGTTALCGDSPADCVDLGTLKCCEAQESCGDSKDNDCDDMVDEGCMCGTTSCSPVGNICCTAEDACGLHAAQTKKCIAPEANWLNDPMCPSATSDSVPLAGCCRADLRCGIFDAQFGFGCVANEDAADVYRLDAPLAPMSCTN